MSPCRLGRPASVDLPRPSWPLRFPGPPGSAGGDEQIRTVDPLLARQVLSQLSYNPNSTCRSCAPYLFLLSTLKIKQRFQTLLTLEVFSCLPFSLARRFLTP